MRSQHDSARTAPLRAVETQKARQPFRHQVKAAGDLLRALHLEAIANAKPHNIDLIAKFVRIWDFAVVSLIWRLRKRRS